MNMNQSLGVDYISNITPCIGCTSTSCRYCSCMGEHERKNEIPPKSYKKQATRVGKSKNAGKKVLPSAQPTVLPVQPVANHSVPKLFTNLPKGIFGAIGEGIILQADGNGMINAGIRTGDWLVFDTKEQLKDGDIALITVDGQPMCRRVFSEGDKKRVRREDGITPDVVTENCVVYAILIGLVQSVRESA